jgi:hypothetical protein
VKFSRGRLGTAGFSDARGKESASRRPRVPVRREGQNYLFGDFAPALATWSSSAITICVLVGRRPPCARRTISFLSWGESRTRTALFFCMNFFRGKPRKFAIRRTRPLEQARPSVAIGLLNNYITTLHLGGAGMQFSLHYSVFAFLPWEKFLVFSSITRKIVSEPGSTRPGKPSSRRRSVR